MGRSLLSTILVASQTYILIFPSGPKKGLFGPFLGPRKREKSHFWGPFWPPTGVKNTSTQCAWHPECFLPKKKSELEEQSHRLARFRYNAQGCQKLTRWSWQQQNRANKKRHPHPLNVQEENANENRHTPPLILTGELRWPEMRQGPS